MPETALSRLVLEAQELESWVSRAREVSFAFDDAHRKIDKFAQGIDKDLTTRSQSCRMHYEIVTGKHRAEDLRAPRWVTHHFGRVMVKEKAWDDET